MKRIVKSREPQQFSDWKEEDKMAHKPNWNRVSGPVKHVIHRALITEQGHICCYCESPVTVDDSHVEHFRPIRQFPSHALEYQNLHCSCLRTLSPGVPAHCGHRKGSWFDEGLLISPLQSDCDKRFKFNTNGEIAARDCNDLQAKETISRLGLDLPSLNSLRAAAVEELQDLSPAEIREVLVRRPDGSFPGYFTTIEDVLL